MNTIINAQTRNDLIQRIALLSDDSQRKWGQMDVKQMIKHCILADEMNQGKKKTKRAFLGRIFGKAILKHALKDDKPIVKNVGTLPEFKMTETISDDLQNLKEQWVKSIQQYADIDDNHTSIHGFFGKMSKTQIGQLAYKHTDHHLRQFGV